MLRGGVSVELAELVRAAGDGDQAAWNSIVERYGGLVWATVRAHRLNTVDGAEVVQTTWLRLVEHLDRIRDPERLGGWLATTARNECLRQIRHSAREVPSELADLERATAAPWIKTSSPLSATGRSGRRSPSSASAARRSSAC